MNFNHKKNNIFEKCDVFVLKLTKSSFQAPYSPNASSVHGRKAAISGAIFSSLSTASVHPANGYSILASRHQVNKLMDDVCNTVRDLGRASRISKNYILEIKNIIL